MENRDIKNRLENLKVPAMQLPPADQKEIKLAVMGAKRSATVSLWILLLPFATLFGAMADSVWHISLPPWSLIKAYGHFWPIWLRMTVFITIVMVLPLFALAINLLSIIWMQYNTEQKVLNISIRLKPVNLILIFIAGLLASVFIGHAIADSIAGRD